MPRTPLKSAFFWFAIVFTIVFDQATKIYASSKLSLGESVEIIPGFFNFVLVHNKGAAFGMFAGLPNIMRLSLMWILSMLAVFMVIVLLLKEHRENKILYLSYGFIIGGAIGNLFDRFFYDYVIDFLDFYIGSNHWPAFNIADSAICVGVFLMLFFELGANRSTQ